MAIKISGFFKSFLSFFNLLDRGNKLSITNVALIICVTKLALASEPSLLDAGALLITVLNYAHKRNEANKAAKVSKIDLESVEIRRSIDGMKIQLNELNELHSTISKQAEEVKQALSATSLGSSMFGGRK